MIYSFFSATLPAFFFSLFLTFDVPLLRVSPRCTMYSPSFHLLPFPLLLPFLPLPLSFSFSFSFVRYSVCLSSVVCDRARGRVLQKRSNAPASQHGPAPSSCIAVSLDLHDPHESPRDSLPTSELRWTKEESKTVQRYTNGTRVHFSILYVDINNFEIHRN